MAKDDKPEKKRGPRQERLPGTEDPAITDLETLAQDYAELRDGRMRILAAEVKKKGEILAAMKKHKRSSYTHESVEIEIEPTGEKLTVRVKKPKDGEGDQVDMT